ncbi:hypothetical protein [Streptomyces sp. NPDC052012]|uniref:hypothetical protein n=1 Tax=Streptomyces sp. NPDC052012 TaxID=3155051 RepID=UPI0034506C94
MTSVLVGLGLAAACAIGALIAAAGVVAMAFPGRPEPWVAHLAYRAAGATAGAAASLYSLGFFAVLASEQEFGDGAASIPAPACRDGFDTETTQGLSHHRSSYLPLRFDCVRDDGTVYSSGPDYVWMNWATASLALATVLLLTIGAVCVGRPRTRKSAVVG